MKKRAQLLSHPFTIILTLVVAAFIIIFGISAIRDLINVSNQVDLSSFTNSLQKEVDTYYSLESGSQKLLSINVPSQVEYICFIDQSADIDYSLIPNEKAGLVRAIKDKNVFFIPARKNPSLDPVNIRNLKPASNPLCVKTINKLEAKIISQGNYVSISQ